MSPNILTVPHTDCNTQNESTLPHNSSNVWPGRAMMADFVAGGKISKVKRVDSNCYCDHLPAVAFDHSKGLRLHQCDNVGAPYVYHRPTQPAVSGNSQRYFENKFPGFTRRVTRRRLLRCRKFSRFSNAASKPMAVRAALVKWTHWTAAIVRLRWPPCRPCGHAFCDDFSDTKTRP
jgi:hypothetical protein